MSTKKNTPLRRNSSANLTVQSIPTQLSQDSAKYSSSSPHRIPSTISAELSNRLNPVDNGQTLNNLNDMGHLSRRVSSSDTSYEPQSSFGFRKVFGGDVEVIAITATTIGNCVGLVIHEMLVEGEDMISKGHCNGAEYEIFCGNGKNIRPKPHQTSDESDSNASPRLVKSSSTNSFSSPFRLGRKTLFPDAEPIPSSQQISRFFVRLCNEALMEYECIVIALIYVRRLIKRSEGRLVLTRYNWRAILFICGVVANKVWDDFHLKNSDYCCIFRTLTVSRINNLEAQLLISLENCCNVSPSAYAETHFEIQAMITMFKIKKVNEPSYCEGRGKKKLFPPKFAKVHAAEVCQHKKLSSPDKTPVSTTAPDEGRKGLSRAISCALSTSDVATTLPKVSTLLFEGGNSIECSPVVIKRQTSIEVEKQKRRNLKAFSQFDGSGDSGSPWKGSVHEKADCHDQRPQAIDLLNDSPSSDKSNSLIECEPKTSTSCFQLFCCFRSEQDDF